MKGDVRGLQRRTRENEGRARDTKLPGSPEAVFILAHIGSGSACGFSCTRGWRGLPGCAPSSAACVVPEAGKGS